MSTFIRLHLEGTRQSWAEAGVGFVKDTSVFPTRSGVIGMVAAAMGLDRNDLMVDTLHQSLLVSSRQLRAGEQQVDYQSVRSWDASGSPTAKPSKDFHIKSQEDLSIGEHVNRQVWRTYLVDAAFEVVLQVNPPMEAETILEYLKHPVMPLYLGRKSCRLSFPLVGSDSLPIEAESPVEVFQGVSPHVRVGYDPKHWHPFEKWVTKRYPEANQWITSLDLPPGTSPPKEGIAIPVMVGDALLSNKARSFTTREAVYWSKS